MIISDLKTTARQTRNWQSALSRRSQISSQLFDKRYERLSGWHVWSADAGWAGAALATFGTDGFTSTPIANVSHVVPFAQVVQPDDKIIVVGYAGFNADTTSDLLLVRYNADGSLDQTFGTGGIVLVDYPAAPYHQTYAAALQPDGKILVFGSLGGVGGDPLVLFRFNSDGSPDTTFGDDGVVYDHFGTNDYPRDVAVQPDGKIVVAGAHDNGDASNRSTFVIRYNADGTRDTSFANDGLFTENFGSSDSIANSIALEPDSRILLGGSIYDGTQHDLALWLLNTDGTLNTDFGTKGSLITDVGSDSGIDTIILSCHSKLIADAGDTGGQWSLVQYAGQQLYTYQGTSPLTAGSLSISPGPQQFQPDCPPVNSSP